MPNARNRCSNTPTANSRRLAIRRDIGRVGGLVEGVYGGLARVIGSGSVVGTDITEWENDLPLAVTGDDPPTPMILQSWTPQAGDQLPTGWVSGQLDIGDVEVRHEEAVINEPGGGPGSQSAPLDSYLPSRRFSLLNAPSGPHTPSTGEPADRQLAVAGNHKPYARFRPILRTRQEALVPPKTSDPTIRRNPGDLISDMRIPECESLGTPRSCSGSQANRKSNVLLGCIAATHSFRQQKTATVRQEQVILSDDVT